MIDEILDDSNDHVDSSLLNGGTDTLEPPAPMPYTDDVNPIGDDDGEDQDYQSREVDGSSVLQEDEVYDVEQEQSRLTAHEETPTQRTSTNKIFFIIGIRK